jgi:hypothetical protein
MNFFPENELFKDNYFLAVIDFFNRFNRRTKNDLWYHENEEDGF